MAVSDNAASLLGISNENEFYAAHYLSEVFTGDIKDTLANWQAKADAEKESGVTQPYQTPYAQLKQIANAYFLARERSQKERNDSNRWSMQLEFSIKLLSAFGFNAQPQQLLVGKEAELPVLLSYPNQEQPQLLAVSAFDVNKEGDDPLSLTLQKIQFEGNGPHLTKLVGDTWFDLINDVIFKLPEPPRWVMLISDRQLLLIDRYKWLQNRLLRFDLDEILGRKDDVTLKATAALLHHESLVPLEGSSLLDNLDENAHRHAFGVSEDLKYALREAIELLGNEAAEQLIERKEISYTGKTALDPDQLSRECLRYMYRMLFLFYIEARPDLAYVPIQSEAYRKGYSLESLRDLEMVKLTSDESRRGHYLHHSIQKLFNLIHQGYQPENQLNLTSRDLGNDSFTLKPLDSHLFDPAHTPYLNKVKFSNQALQTIIRLMSLTRETSGRGSKRRGRVSYAQLGINQLGAVYEALLSYRGFFAHEDLYEVKKADATFDELDTGYFVTAAEIGQYDEDEKVKDKDENGHSVLRKHPRGKFIYRMAGRDREKSASYYTPEVLTKALVKYTLKERIPSLTADEILSLSVCEPAMGSAAFLNEAVNQLAEAYLTKKQEELNQRIPHDDYKAALQTVKMHIADHNVYGVDLNPIAVELAEVSLWLNALNGSNQVPWFGYQLFNGNSLIGSRRQVYHTEKLTEKKRNEPKEKYWYHHEPKRLDPLQPTRADEEVYHFLLPDPGMANYTDADAKNLKPEAFKAIKEWRNEFTKPLEPHEISLLKRLSAAIDTLWKQHTDTLRADRAKTEDQFTIWGQAGTGYATSTADKDQIRAKGIFNHDAKIATPYHRLKLVMDYWCALWFWPISQAEQLPDRSSWLMELNLVLHSEIYQFEPQGQVGFDFDQREPNTPVFEFASPQISLIDEVQPDLTAQQVQLQQVLTAKGELHLPSLYQQFPRLGLVETLADRYKFFHWELTFADVFKDKGGFDIILGNPPWLKVEWNESGILGDFNPAFIIKKYSATKLRNQRAAAFEKYTFLENSWFLELEYAECTQNFLNAIQNYPELKGQKASLDKCFLPQSWRLSNLNGVCGLLHPESIYNDANGGEFREKIYSRIRAHFQFENQKKLFPIGNTRTYSINIYGTTQESPIFFNISNLYLPRTIDECFKHNGDGVVPGIKDSNNQWETKGHRSRIISVNSKALKVFSELYNEAGTYFLQTTLPPIHSIELIKVLENFSKQTKHLGDIKNDYFSTQHWNESNAQNDGTIERKTIFASNPTQWIFSGPHFYIGNPYHQTPRKVCETHRAYDKIDLTDLPQDYLPRTNFIPSLSVNDYIRRNPKLPWIDSNEIYPKSVTDVYRLIYRRQLDSSGERTLLPAVVPPGASHLDGGLSIAFKHQAIFLSVLSSSISIPFDFFLRASGKGTLTADFIKLLPIMEQFILELSVRSLSLISLTSLFSKLWENFWDKRFKSDKWTCKNLVDQDFFTNLEENWHRSCALRTDYVRRQAQLEIDVLVAKALGMTLKELITIYQTQFPVLNQNEKETYYDQNGRIVFTPSMGLVGVGLSRNSTNNDPPVKIEYPDGRVENRPLGWSEAINLPEGTKIHRTIEDDTLPSGPRQKTITYVSPWYLPNREEDYKLAWEVFTERMKEDGDG